MADINTLRSSYEGGFEHADRLFQWRLGLGCDALPCNQAIAVETVAKPVSMGPWPGRLGTDVLASVSHGIGVHDGALQRQRPMQAQQRFLTPRACNSNAIALCCRFISRVGCKGHFGQVLSVPGYALRQA